MRSMDDFHNDTWGTEMHVVAGRDVVEINCYPLGGVAKGQIVTFENSGKNTSSSRHRMICCS